MTNSLLLRLCFQSSLHHDSPGEHQGNQRSGFLLRENQDGARRLGATGTTVWAVVHPHLLRQTMCLNWLHLSPVYVLCFCVNFQGRYEHKGKWQDGLLCIQQTFSGYLLRSHSTVLSSLELLVSKTRVLIPCIPGSDKVILSTPQTPTCFSFSIPWLGWPETIKLSLLSCLPHCFMTSQWLPSLHCLWMF